MITRLAGQTALTDIDEKESDRQIIIESDDVLKPGSVGNVESPGEMLRIKAAAGIAAASLLIGVIFLIASLFNQDKELQVWASGLISLVVGAAIGFIFSGGTNGRS